MYTGFKGNIKKGKGRECYIVRVLIYTYVRSSYARGIYSLKQQGSTIIVNRR